MPVEDLKNAYNEMLHSKVLLLMLQNQAIFIDRLFPESYSLTELVDEMCRALIMKVLIYMAIRMETPAPPPSPLHSAPPSMTPLTSQFYRLNLHASAPVQCRQAGSNQLTCASGTGL